MDPDIARILAKLRQARKRGLKPFGSKAHHLLLQKPYAEETVHAFEQQLGITLPGDIRRFILQAGATGAAPAYGLLPMERWVRDADATRLNRDSPIYPGVELTDEELAADDLEDRLEDGALTIIDGGCSESFLLIITGRYRGRIVLFDPENVGRPYFTRDAGFLAGYERWLDELLAGWEVGWFSYGLPGNTRKLIEVLNSPESSSVDRVDALRTVGRIPQLGEPLTQIVLRGMTDPQASVRASCASLAAQKKLPNAEPALLALCADSEAFVRIAALGALCRFRSKAWPEQARQALLDPDESVVCSMLIRLAMKGPIARADLEPLVAAASPKIRRLAMRAWGASEFKISDASWLEARLRDDDSGVRRELIRAAVAARDQAAIPQLRQLPEWKAEEMKMFRLPRTRVLRWIPISMAILVFVMLVTLPIAVWAIISFSLSLAAAFVLLKRRKQGQRNGAHSAGDCSQSVANSINQRRTTSRPGPAKSTAAN